MLLEIFLIIIGFVLLIKGADLLVIAATSIAKKFGLSEMIIGLTIVAIGTSLPEIFVTVTSSFGNHSDLIIGNAIGSCICNFLLVIGITSLVRPIKLDKRIVKTHLPIGMAAMILLLFLGNTDKFGGSQTITRWQGVVLLVCSVLYILYTIYEEKRIKNAKIDEEIIKSVESKEKKSLIRIFVYILVGILGLKLGADYIVENAVSIASRLGLSEKIIGMTIIAIGTALPEIITGIIAAKNDETDLLLGNISGSNIINLCLLIGLGAVISPLTFTSDFNIGIFVLIAVTLLLQFIATVNEESKLDGKRGILLIFVYILYIVSMF